MDLLNTIIANPWTIPVAALGAWVLAGRVPVFCRRSPSASALAAIPVPMPQAAPALPPSGNGECVRTVRNEYGTSSTLIGSRWGTIEFISVPNDDADAHAAGFPAEAYHGMSGEGDEPYLIDPEDDRRVYMRRSAYDAMRGELSRILPMPGGHAVRLPIGGRP